MDDVPQPDRRMIAATARRLATKRDTGLDRCLKSAPGIASSLKNGVRSPLRRGESVFIPPSLQQPTVQATLHRRIGRSINALCGK